ncbi:hypothetical protein CAPTEDRAFT_211470 [Capitella teleta]|uniref:Uncharacterized protein n=1 Tax=Capitella teleta TaxID=283909 RepID=R7V1V2_CAPTE|nr:hypothetical protein CAPTEDRAFT_211470 [Capitella teleta]|eukprot:ELU12477.1 hypothetical protein CAPTEDRAFT_211470 [Capitella teleta]
MADILANADDYTPTSDNGELKQMVSAILDQMNDLHANTTRIANALKRIGLLEKDLDALRTENSQLNEQMIRQSQVIKQDIHGEDRCQRQREEPDCNWSSLRHGRLGNNAVHETEKFSRYLQKKSIHPLPVLMKWDIAVREAAFYEAHRLTRFHKQGPFNIARVIV